MANHPTVGSSVSPDDEITEIDSRSPRPNRCVQAVPAGTGWTGWTTVEQLEPLRARQSPPQKEIHF